MHRDEHLGTVTAWLLAGALFLSLAWPIAVGRTFVSDDLGGFHLPIRQFYARCLASGDDYRWFPGLYCGFYVHGESQAGMAHPLHWLLYRTLPLGSAMQAEIVLGYPAMFLGMAVWLRRLGLRRRCFGTRRDRVRVLELPAPALCPRERDRGHRPPALALARDRGPRSPRTATGAAWAGAGIAALTASQILMGYPQYVGFSLILEGGYALLRFGKAYRIWLRWMIAKALGLFASAAQLLPLVEAPAGSVRANPSRDFLGNNSLHPWNLAQDRRAPRVPARLLRRRCRGRVAEARVRRLSRGDRPGVLRLALDSPCGPPAMSSARGLGAGIRGDRDRALAREEPAASAVPDLREAPYSPSCSAHPSRYLVVAQMASAVLAAVAFSDLASLVAHRATPASACVAPPARPGGGESCRGRGPRVPVCGVTVASACRADRFGSRHGRVRRGPCRADAPSSPWEPEAGDTPPSR